MGVVPPFLPGELLQGHAGEQLQAGAQEDAPQEQEEGGVGQLGEEDGEQHPAQAVHRGEGGAEEAAVEQPALAQGGQGGLAHPAQEGVDQKQPQQLINGVVHEKPRLVGAEERLDPGPVGL